MGILRQFHDVFDDRNRLIHKGGCARLVFDLPFFTKELVDFSVQMVKQHGCVCVCFRVREKGGGGEKLVTDNTYAEGGVQ